MKNIFKSNCRSASRVLSRGNSPSPQLSSGIEPMISSHNPEFLSAISIKGGRGQFTEMGPATEYLGGDALTDIHSLASQNDIDQYLKNDPYPLPATIDRENYHGERHYDWWLSGLKDFLLIQSKMEEHGAKLTPGESISDLGCASGRVLRHFVIQRQDLDCWGADINLRHIEWMRHFLPDKLRIFQNTVLPHIPVEDSSYSLVTAFSVFTHIDDLEFAWLAEVRRVLKPGGIFYATIHSERTWDQMKPGVPIYDALMHMRVYITEYEVSDSFLNGPMPKEKTVFRWDTAQNYNCNVFHRMDYVRREWGRFFDILEIIPCGSDYQDVVILRKKS